MRRESAETAHLFHHYGPVIYRRALRLLGCPEDAEEATQEVFVKFLRHHRGLKEPEKLLNWLYRTTTNHCLNQIRGRGRRAALHSAYIDHRVRPEQPVEMLTMQRLLADAPPKQAEAAVFVHIHGMSYREAAKVLGVSARTVGNLLERFNTLAARRLRTDGGAQ